MACVTTRCEFRTRLSMSCTSREFTALRQPADEMAVNDTGCPLASTSLSARASRRSDRRAQRMTCHRGLHPHQDLLERGRGREVRRKGQSRNAFDGNARLRFRWGSRCSTSTRCSMPRRSRSGWEVGSRSRSVGKQIMAVFVDIHGNEAREVIPRELSAALGTRRPLEAGLLRQPARRPSAEHSRRCEYQRDNAGFGIEDSPCK